MMTLELRPKWCLDEDLVSTALELGDWMIEGKRAFERHGDDWQPGDKVVVTRDIRPLLKPVELRRKFGLAAGQVVGVAARWSCRDTSFAGVHVGGPVALDLDEDLKLTLDIPVEIARSIEIETCLIVNRSTSKHQPGSAPAGSILWSDSWAQPLRERMVLLEGAEARIPVRSVSFEQQFGELSSALWAIDLDTTIAFDDLFANVVTVLLNKDVTSRDFRGEDNEPDVAKIPNSLLAGIQVDLLRSLTSVLQEELNQINWSDLRHLEDFEDGSIGQWLGIQLIKAFGSTSSAINAYLKDESFFNRELWNLFAPNSWSSSK